MRLNPTALTRFLLLLLLPAATARAEEPLFFEAIPIRGGTLQLERALLEHREVAVAGAERFIAHRREANVRAVAQQRRAAEVVAVINDLLGVTADAATVAEQQEVYTSFVGGLVVSLAEDFTLYVVLQSSSKAYLAAGGSIPNLTYDAARDTAALSVRWSWSSEEEVQALPLTSFTFPIETPADIARLGDASSMFDPGGVGVPIHEVAEMTLIRSIRFTGFQRRWFCDGMANAIAIAALRRLGEHDERQIWLNDLTRNDERYAALGDRANLRYWRAKEYEVQTPLADEQTLTHARYHFATRIIQDLVDRHGDAILARIVREAIAAGKLSSDETLALLDRVTGERVADRVRSHDEHPGDEAAISAYTAAFAAAAEAGDKQATLSTLLRLMEARLTDTYSPLFYSRAADLLRELGHIDAGAAVLQQQLRTARNVGDAQKESDLAGVYHSLLAKYAVDVDQPSIADASAEALLAFNPRYVDALTIRADRLSREGDAEGAREIARRLRRDAPEKLTPEIQRILDRIEPRPGN